MRGSAALYKGQPLGSGPVGQPQPEIKYQRTMVSIDSVDRDYFLYPNAGQYVFKLPTMFKNVVAIRLLSMEVPASFYIFSAAAGNTSILLKEAGATWKTITIADGNYSIPDLCMALQEAIISATDNTTYTVTLNCNTLKITIANSSTEFRIDTSTGSKPQGLFWGLGYFLGFDKGNYSSSGKAITGPRIANISPYNYMVLDLDELNMIQEGDTVKGYFAKVPLNVNNFNYVYLTPECCSYNIAKYDPPIGKLDTLRILWRFHDCTKIDFNGFEHSFLVEIITGEGKLAHPQINQFSGAGAH